MARCAIVGVLCCGVMAMGAEATGQTAYRLKGTARVGDKPVAATVTAEAIHGFRGEQFVGQKDFTTPSDDKGAWNLLGLTAGVWLFTARAPGMLPAVTVLPVRFAQRQMQSAQGGQLAWPLLLTLTPGEAYPALLPAIPLLEEGRLVEALQFLGPALAPDATPGLRCAAGQLAVALKQSTLAHQLFTAVHAADARNLCGATGLAAVALMRADWDTASKMLWTARDIAPRDQRPALAAAVTELQQISALK